MIKKKKPKVKKPKYDKKIADKIFAEIIRTPGKCHRCNSEYRIQCAHIISRTYYTVRWSLDNAIPLCSGCHVFFTYHPLEWEEYIIGKFGEEHWLDLKKRARTYEKIDYKAIIERLEGQQKLF